MAKIDDIIKDTKQETLLQMFESAKSMIDLCKRVFGVCDNTSNVKKIKDAATSIGFDISIYHKKQPQQKRYCLNCGKELIGKDQTKFCCRSCSTSYNNRLRPKKDKPLKQNQPHKQQPKTERIKKEYKCKEYKCICKECGKEFVSKRSVTSFCGSSCLSKYVSRIKHKERLKYYYEHQDEYVGVQDTLVKKFKPDFINEQHNACAICGIKPTWNGRSLVFVLDHIDGDATNNVRSNLRCICPNCDSQLDTYKSKNPHSTRRSYYREKTIRLAKESIKSDIL